MKIERATLLHLDAIHDLIRDCFAPYVPRIGRMPAPMTADHAPVVQSGNAYIVPAPETTSGIAAVLIVDRPSDALLIDTVAVAPNMRGKGIAQHLITFAQDLARGEGLECLRLYTNEAMVEALAMYLHLGFKETKRVTEAGLNRVYLERHIL